MDCAAGPHEKPGCGRRAFDAWWLTGMTGAEPTEGALHALLRMRQRWLHGPRR
jgi:hypothetical protein